MFKGGIAFGESMELKVNISIYTIFRGTKSYNHHIISDMRRIQRHD